MSISSRITQIEQHLTDDYSVLELAGADLTNVDKNIENLKQSWEERLLYFLANGTDTLWNNWEKVTGSGTEISLNNTIEAKMDFIYKGNTSQSGEPTPDTPVPVQVVSGDNTIKVEGKNLLDTKVFENRRINCYVVNSNGTITQTATDTNFWQSSYLPNSIILNKGTYTISVNNRNGSKLQVYNLTTNSNIVEASVDSYTFTLNNDNQVINVKLYGASSYPFTFTMQLEKGNQASSFIPYQSQTYPISLGVENMFDKSSATLGYRLSTAGENYGDSDYYVSSLIKVKPNTTYTKNSPIANAYHRVAFYSTNSLSGFISVKDNNNTFTTPSTCEYIKFCGLRTEIDNAKLVKGDHIQYISANPIELCKIGDYQDRIYKDNGKWYLHKEIGKLILDGTENWSSRAFPGNSYLSVKMTLQPKKNGGLCNYFISNNNYDIVNEHMTISNRWNELCFAILNSRLSTADVDGFKNWLSTNKPVVYYVLATPTYEEITDTTLISQLEAIKKSYNTQTNISQENNDLPFELDVVALGELESV